ncbi:MAG: 3-dehydroquinate synthase [Ignavibacteria bacterium]|nr:3-dehydroquinate synthase [Ignavibacteria bacterium]
MKTFDLLYSNSATRTVIGGNINDLQKFVPYLSKKENCFAVVDENVNRLYPEILPGIVKIILSSGEKSKNLSTIEQLYSLFLDMGVVRSSLIIGIGGGVALDIVGYAAATYYRGIRCGFIATTLLAQVDAAFGGKNGINYDKYKNIIGSIHQPEFVLCDFKFLETLPEQELKNGFAEIIKSSLIGNAKLFDFLINNSEYLLQLDKIVLERVVEDCIKIKTDIVKQDENEKGIRKILNFGHTIGHAIEAEYKLPHGQAILHGMEFAIWVSMQIGMLQADEYSIINELILKFKQKIKNKFEPKKILNNILKDKKKSEDKIDFILLEKIGKPLIMPISINDLKEYLNQWSMVNGQWSMVNGQWSMVNG